MGALEAFLTKSPVKTESPVKNWEINAKNITELITLHQQRCKFILACLSAEAEQWVSNREESKGKQFLNVPLVDPLEAGLEPETLESIYEELRFEGDTIPGLIEETQELGRQLSQAAKMVGVKGTFWIEVHPVDETGKKLDGRLIKVAEDGGSVTIALQKIKKLRWGFEQAPSAKDLIG